MACSKMQRRRITLRRKFQILTTLTKSKSVKKSSIIMDASIYIHKLRLQVEAIKREYQHLINHIQEVKVDNLGTEYLVVRITCKKGEEMLHSILEAFEQMNLNIVEASITCKHFFGLEAIVKADVNASFLNHTILNLVQMHTQ